MMLISMSKILLIRSLADIGKTHSSAKSKVDEMDLIVIWEKLWKVVYFDNFGVLQKISWCTIAHVGMTLEKSPIVWFCGVLTSSLMPRT